MTDPIESNDRDVLAAEVERLDAEAKTLGADIAGLEAELADMRRSREELVAAKKKRRATVRAVVLATLLVSVVVGVATTFHLVRGFEGLGIEGEVRAVDGPIPVAVGEPCRVTVIPEIGPFNASFIVQCGDLRLYGGGGSGYGQCDVDDDRPMRCHDSGDIGVDGDPAIDFDQLARRMRVSDRTWSVEIGWSG